MGNDPEECNHITPPWGKSHYVPCPRHTFTMSGSTPGRTQLSPRRRPRQDCRVNRAEKTTALDNKANACRKRGAYETCLVCLTLGWHQRLSKTPAKHTPAISAWFLSSLGSLQPPREVQACVGRMSLLYCFTPKWGLPSPSLFAPDLRLI